METVINIFKIILLLAFVLGSAKYDSTKLIIDHVWRWLLRFWVVFILAWGDVGNFIIYSAIFYALFDYSYNYFRGNTVFYIGDTATHDKVWRILGWKKLIAFKAVCVLIAFNLQAILEYILSLLSNQIL